MEKIGAGAECSVYVHPFDNDFALKLYEPTSLSNPIILAVLRQMQFYLTNIIALLFPENVPRLREIGSHYGRYKISSYSVVERVFPDTQYQQLMSADLFENAPASDFVADWSDLETQYMALLEAHTNRLESLVAYQRIIQSFSCLELSYDPRETNFAVTSSENVVYLDKFNPWLRLQRKDRRVANLRQCMDDLLSETDKKRADIWLMRYLVLNQKKENLVNP